MAATRHNVSRGIYRYGPVVELYVFDCDQCGIVFGIPIDFDNARRRDGARTYCPNGHTLTYHETDLDRERRARAASDARATALRDQLEAERREADRTRRSLAATKGQVTKMRKRALAGVCPCCKRSFVSVVRHMHTKHPAEAKLVFGDGKKSREG